MTDSPEGLLERLSQKTRAIIPNPIAVPKIKAHQINKGSKWIEMTSDEQEKLPGAERTRSILTSAQRKELRGRAMQKTPSVLIGRSGVTPAIIASINDAFSRAALIKIRISGHDRQSRIAILDELCQKTDATLCGQVGQTASLYRANESK